MFPDVPMLRAVAGEIQAHARHGFAYAGIACGLFALTGLRQGDRLRICRMAGLGLVLAAYVIVLSWYLAEAAVHH